MFNFLNRLLEAFQEWLWELTPGPLGPLYDDVGGIGREPLMASKKAVSGTGFEPATAPMQMKRCAQCGELSRLYKVDGRAVCAKCAKGGSK